MKALLHENMGLKNPISLELWKGSASEKARLDMILIQKKARQNCSRGSPNEIILIPRSSCA